MPRAIEDWTSTIFAREDDSRGPVQAEVRARSQQGFVEILDRWAPESGDG